MPITLLCGMMATLYTTPDNRTSIPFDDIPGLQVCRTYASIVVTPIVPPFGPIQSSRGVGFNVALISSGTEIMYTITHTHAEQVCNRNTERPFLVSNMLSEDSMSLIHWLLNVLVHGCSLYSPSLEYISPIAVEYSCFGFIATRICSYM